MTSLRSLSGAPKSRKLNPQIWDSCFNDLSSVFVRCTSPAAALGVHVTLFNDLSSVFVRCTFDTEDERDTYQL